MSWIDDYKGAGPWPFIEQKDKCGYLNNPRWSNHPKGAADSVSASEFCESIGLSTDPETHKPCGHWHKGPVPTIIQELTTESIWQQSVEVLKSDELLGVAGMSNNNDNEYVLYISDFDGNLESVYVFSINGTVPGYPGSILFNKIGGVPTVFYRNTVRAEDDSREYHFYSLNSEGVTVQSRISSEYYIDSDNYMSYIYYYVKGLAISDSGTLISVEEVNLMNAGVLSHGFNIQRSTNYGNSWTFISFVDLLTTPSTPNTPPSIDCDSDGNFYIIISDNTLPYKPFRMWKSTDDGLTWNEVLTVPATPNSKSRYLWLSISDDKIYVASTITANNTYTWISSDGGSTWSAAHAVSIPGYSYFTYISIAANDDVLIMRGIYLSYAFLLRSDDQGLTWVSVGRVDPPTDWPTYMELYRAYQLLNNDNDYFVFTACGDYIIGTDYLGCLLSIDDGLMWEAKELKISRTLGVPLLFGGESSNEPQVWPMDF